MRKRRNRKTGTARSVRHKWLLDSAQEIEAITLAQARRSNRSICQATGLTNSQVSYILHKSKSLEGYQPYHTYRSEWDNGTSAAYRQFEARILPGLRRRNVTTLPGLITHPTPEVEELAE